MLSAVRTCTQKGLGLHTAVGYGVGCQIHRGFELMDMHNGILSIVPSKRPFHVHHFPSWHRQHGMVYSSRPFSPYKLKHMQLLWRVYHGWCLCDVVHRRLYEWISVTHVPIQVQVVQRVTRDNLSWSGMQGPPCVGALSGCAGGVKAKKVQMLGIPGRFLARQACAATLQDQGQEDKTCAGWGGCMMLGPQTIRKQLLRGLRACM